MPQELGKKPRRAQERSDTPLWWAIGGLLFSVFGFSRHTQVGDVIFWTGLVLALIAVVYWFVQPRHGFK
ncbi:MAG: hypothetical protein N2444_05360 [Methylocystis sp.]|nr:hypothetical protein [Methylocystis sp.]